MKKILQLLILCLATNISFGQALWSIDFEDGTLGDMTTVNNDGLTPNPNVGYVNDAWVAIPVGQAGSIAAVSNSWYAPVGMADDWLITPQLSITDEKTALQWQALATDPNFADGYEVRVSTTDNSIESFTDIIWETASEQASGSLANREVNLAEYVGKDIYIAFRNNSFDKFLLVLDNITVRVVQSRDVRVNRFSGARYHEKNMDIPVTVSITNYGSETLNSFMLNWSDGTNNYSNEITGLNLAPLSSTNVTSDDVFVATEAITYPLDIWTSMPNGEVDLDPSNDEIVGTVAGVSFVPNRKVVAEEGTGTWCGWCPRGEVGLNTMYEEFPDNFIGIAVHNNDPMAISTYDGPLGINGFPGSKVNRLIDSDPSEDDLRPLVTLIKDIVSPMAPRVTAMGNVEDRTIDITVESEFVTQLENINFRLAAVIIEDGVTGTGNGYAQSNFYSGGNNGPMGGYENLPNPVPASMMVYNHVARAILGGFDGVDQSVPASVVEGDVATYDFAYTAPPFFDMEKMKVVVLVIDNETGEILNAEEEKVMLPVNTTNVDESISRIYPNPTSGLTYLDLNIEEASEVNLQVVDLVGKVVSNQYLGRLNGSYNMTYDVSNLDAGMYLFRVTAGDKVSTKKITVIK